MPVGQKALTTGLKLGIPVLDLRGAQGKGSFLSPEQQPHQWKSSEAVALSIGLGMIPRTCGV